MSATGTIAVAIIGAGSMARAHAQAFADIPGVVLAGIYSRTTARAEALAAEFGIPAVCSSIEELHTRTASRLVIIAVPELAARTVAEIAFRFPWAVLMEKPAGYDLADARAIAAAATAADADNRVWVALNRRHYSVTRAVLADLADDPAPRFIQIFDQEAPEAARAGGQPETVVRNWMYANSIHMVDYAAVLGRGPITAVEPVIPWTPERPGVVAARIAFAGGDDALYQAVWNAPGPWACAVGTSRRRWEMRPLERATFQNAGDRTLHPVEPDAWDLNFKAGFRHQADLAVRAVRGETTALPSLADSLRSMRLVAAVYGHEAWSGD